MTVSQDSAYTQDMSWKEYLTSEEQAELQAVSDAKARVVEEYNTVWKKLKTRCDARMRRDKAKEDQ